MNIRLFAVIVVLACFILAGRVMAMASVTNEVKKTVDEVVRIVSDKEFKKSKNEKQKRKELKAAISAMFDYGEMTQRAMGGHWKELSDPEMKEITCLFETLLENSYANKIESYNNERIIYLKEITDEDYAEVKSKIVTSKRDEYAVNYRLMNKGGRWVVYDVVIEGVSLVSNYRTQFGKIISKQGYKELAKKLRSKSEEIKPL